MNRVLKIAGTTLAVLILIYFVWRFSDIVTYLIISIVLSIVGRPLVRFFNSIHIGKIHIPNTLSAFLSLLVILILTFSFASIFIPLVASQASIVSDIDFNALGNNIQKPLQDFEEFMKEYNLLTPDETIRQVVTTQIEELLSFASFSDTITSILGLTGSIFIALFSILFLTFFFLKDAYLLDEIVETLTPAKFQNEVGNVLRQTKRLLGRYFVGLVVELTTMITLISSGLAIFGVRNALLIGFFGGLMNVIPYLGPIIGATIGTLLAVFSILAAGMLSEVVHVVFIVIGVFAAANLIDNTVLQPLIYSNSVKAHPVEIFLVILIAGSLAGIPGMILAIPTYTMLRVIAKEFLSQFKVVQSLTRNI
jgi:predicted PurR-regulated permease PerM